jgi:DNA-binding LytR/AlgR family response regulator
LKVVFASTNVQETVLFLTRQEADVLFLDISLQGLNGLDIAKLLPDQLKIVFTTAHAEYALRSYEANSLDYLLKPIAEERFGETVVKIINWFKHPNQPFLKPQQGILFVKSGSRYCSINLEEVVFFEGKADYISCILVHGQILFKMRMKELEKKLFSHFYRIHNSYIVNVKMIDRIEDNLIKMKGASALLPLSEKYKVAFMKDIWGITLNGL